MQTNIIWLYLVVNKRHSMFLSKYYYIIILLKYLSTYLCFSCYSQSYILFILVVWVFSGVICVMHDWHLLTPFHPLWYFFKCLTHLTQDTCVIFIIYIFDPKRMLTHHWEFLTHWWIFKYELLQRAEKKLFPVWTKIWFWTELQWILMFLIGCGEKVSSVRGKGQK